MAGSCGSGAVCRQPDPIQLALVLALAGWSTVGAEDGFYVIPTTKPNYAPVPKTGQTAYYGTNDDGTLEKGVAWPTPRFTDNGNGTVTDKLTGLVWLKDANCMGFKTWDDALAAANGLADGQCGLADGSKPLDWRLPNVRELASLIDYGNQNPALPGAHPSRLTISWTTGLRLGVSGSTSVSFTRSTSQVMLPERSSRIITAGLEMFWV